MNVYSLLVAAYSVSLFEENDRITLMFALHVLESCVDTRSAMLIYLFTHFCLPLCANEQLATGAATDIPQLATLCLHPIVHN